nr:hypothetical protein [Pleurocapsa sp. PCC 7327]
MNRKRLSQIGSAVLSLLLFTLSLWAISQELQKYHIREVWKSLADIPTTHLFLAVELTGLNYVMLTGYDTLAVRYIRYPLSYRKKQLWLRLSVMLLAIVSVWLS